MEERSAAIPTWIVISTLGTAFAAMFLTPLDQWASQDLASVCYSLAARVLALAAIALYSYRRAVSLVQLLIAFVALLLANFLLSTFMQDETVLLRAFIWDGSVGMSLAIMGSLLSTIPRERIRQDVILGFALSALIAAAAGIACPDAVLVHNALLGAYLVLLVIAVAAAKQDRLVFEPASKPILALGGLKRFYRSLPSTQRSSMLFTLVIATVLSPMLGVFESYASANNISLSSDTSILVVSAIASLGVVIIGRKSKSYVWFGGLFAFLMLIIILGLAAMLLMPAIQRPALKVFGIATLIAMTPPCVFTIELALDRGISPVFMTTATLPPLISVGFGLGHAINLLILQWMGPEGYSGTAVAAISLLIIAAIAVMLSVAVAVGTHAETDPNKAQNDPGEKPTAEKNLADEVSPEEAPNDPAAILMKRFGLSRREADVCILFAHGRSAVFIAEDQCLAESTVRTYLKRSYLKMGIHKRQELIDLLESC